ncbi:MAG: hypothetical protein AAGA48_25025 [Myxococcota bacterium]
MVSRVVFLSLVPLIGCSSVGVLSSEMPSTLENGQLAVTLDQVGACYNKSETDTAVFVGFVGRDPKTGEPAGVQACQGITGEDVLTEGASGIATTNLPSDLSVTLVLDASTSMVDRGIFNDMIQSAQGLVADANTTWRGRPGILTWRFVWFNDFIFEPVLNGPPQVEDLNLITAPKAGAATRLYAAIDYGIQLADANRTADNGSINGNSDILVVFSDGGDNASERDIAVPKGLCDKTVCSVTQPPVVERVGQLVRKVNERDWLQVFGLALQERPDDDFEQIVTANGRGRLIEGDGGITGAQVRSLFADALLEFVERRAIGFYGPVSFGEQTWTVRFHRTVEQAEKNRAGLVAEFTFDPENLPACDQSFVKELGDIELDFPTDERGTACTFVDAP